MAINKEEIIKAYYNGNAELFAYPQHPDYGGYFEPLDKMPDSVKELFEYDPDKAKKLLAEAGYPNGFTFKMQVCSCSPDHMDLLPLVAAYLEQVGVKIEIQPMEYARVPVGDDDASTHAPGYFMNNGHTNPTTTHPQELRHRAAVEPVAWSDPEFDAKMDEVYQERDESKRKAMIERDDRARSSTRRPTSGCRRRTSTRRGGRG